MRASRTRAAGRSGAIMEAMHRGTLRIYLGAAPGVGKTYAMLGEAHRRSSRGTESPRRVRRLWCAPSLVESGNWNL